MTGEDHQETAEDQELVLAIEDARVLVKEDAADHVIVDVLDQEAAGVEDLHRMIAPDDVGLKVAPEDGRLFADCLRIEDKNQDPRGAPHAVHHVIELESLNGTDQKAHLMNLSRENLKKNHQMITSQHSKKKLTCSWKKEVTISEKQTLQ